jgi:hypothetical protein
LGEGRIGTPTLGMSGRRKSATIEEVYPVRKPRVRVAVGVEELEPRELLSGVTPVLTMHTYNAVTAEVRDVIGRLSRTHDVGRAAAGLEKLAAEVPFGRQQLLPDWLGDLGGYSRQVPGSGLAVEREILSDLNRDILSGVSSGEFKVTGPGSAAFRSGHVPGVGAPVVSVASVNIVNSTGLNITVSAFLTGTSQSITKPIGVNGSALFDFGSSSNNFISINIARSDGRQPPPPSTGNILNRPISGYNGKSFTVSVFSNFFSVSV